MCAFVLPAGVLPQPGSIHACARSASNAYATVDYTRVDLHCDLAVDYLQHITLHRDWFRQRCPSAWTIPVPAHAWLLGLYLYGLYHDPTPTLAVDWRALAVLPPRIIARTLINIGLPFYARFCFVAACQRSS